MELEFMNDCVHRNQGIGIIELERTNWNHELELHNWNHKIGTNGLESKNWNGLESLNWNGKES